MQIIPTEQYFDMVRRELAEKGEAFVRVTGISMQPLLRHLKDGVVIVQAIISGTWKRRSLMTRLWARWHP